MRLAVLWTHLSGYLNACLKALADQGDELFVSSTAPSDSAPFDRQAYSWLQSENHREWRGGGIDEGALLHALKKYRPDALLVSGWSVREYTRVVASFRGEAVRILAMDNPWQGTLRQFVGVTASSWYIRPYYEGIFVPGERQYQFARKLGFPESRILRGLLVADQPRFATAAANCRNRQRSFVYVGRFSPEKGIDILLDGYVKYRRSATEPWPLVMIGAGPLKKIVERVDGIEVAGFVQPAELPELLAKQGCLVLPSIFEPWALVIHEAASAGLPIICTNRCGASVHLVCDGYNGLIIEPGNSEILARALAKVAGMSGEELDAASRGSRMLSEQFTPARWAQYLRGRVEELARTCMSN